MGVASDGNPFGVPGGLFCSFPVLCRGDGEWSFAEGFLLKEEAGHQLSLSVKVRACCLCATSDRERK